jgi:hypothetical protein
VQTLVTAQDFADALNRLRLTDPMWEEGGFRVAGRWLEIDPDASDALAATMLRCSIERARRRNEIEARWIVAGGVAVVYTDDHGWQAVPDWRRPVELDEPAATAAVPLLVSEPPVGSSSSAEA